MIPRILTRIPVRENSEVVVIYHWPLIVYHHWIDDLINYYHWLLPLTIFYGWWVNLPSSSCPSHPSHRTCEWSATPPWCGQGHVRSTPWKITNWDSSHTSYYIYMYIHNNNIIYIYHNIYIYVYIIYTRSTSFFEQHLAISEMAKDVHFFKPPTPNLSHSRTQYHSAKVSAKSTN